MRLTRVPPIWCLQTPPLHLGRNLIDRSLQQWNTWNSDDIYSGAPYLGMNFRSYFFTVESCIFQAQESSKQTSSLVGITLYTIFWAPSNVLKKSQHVSYRFPKNIFGNANPSANPPRTEYSGWFDSVSKAVKYRTITHLSTYAILILFLLNFKRKKTTSNKSFFSCVMQCYFLHGWDLLFIWTQEQGVSFRSALLLEVHTVLQHYILLLQSRWAVDSSKCT